MLTIERGDLVTGYTWSAGDTPGRWHPGEAAHADIVKITWRGRPVLNIGNRNLSRIEDEVAASHR